MGFSQVATFAILLSAFLFFMAQMGESVINSNREVGQAWQDAADRAEKVRQASVDIESGSYNQGQDLITLTINNNGAVGFNASLVDVVVDGVVHTSDITSLEVDSAATDVWPPLTTLEMKVSYDSTPSDVAIITQTGAKSYWREF